MFALLLLAAGLADPPANGPVTKDGKHAKLTAHLAADKANFFKLRLDVEPTDGWKVQKATYELWSKEAGGGWQVQVQSMDGAANFVAGEPTAKGRKTVYAFVEQSCRTGVQVQVREVKLFLHDPTANPKAEEVIEIKELKPVTIRATDRDKP